MNGFKRSTSATIVVFLICCCFLYCDKTPTDPGDSIPWSRITGEIAFSRSHSLFILDGDAQKEKEVKKNKEGYFGWLAWHPDGDRIIFSDYVSDPLRAQLYSIKTDGSNRSIIYSTEAHNNYPALSSNGRLAYWYNGAGFPLHMEEIWIDNSPFFGKAMCDMTRPAWSPDGQFLVVSMRDSTSQGALYKVSLNDTSFIPLLQGSGFENRMCIDLFHDPIYSPDGNTIAFTKYYPSRDNDNSEIWVIQSDGSNPRQLTNGAEDWYPAWSPDGGTIAFVRGNGDEARIYVMNSDGSDVTQVTEHESLYPIWK